MNSDMEAEVKETLSSPATLMMVFHHSNRNARHTLYNILKELTIKNKSPGLLEQSKASTQGGDTL